jgi:hypothetical protein
MELMVLLQTSLVLCFLLIEATSALAAEVVNGSDLMKVPVMVVLEAAAVVAAVIVLELFLVLAGQDLPLEDLVMILRVMYSLMVE